MPAPAAELRRDPALPEVDRVLFAGRRVIVGSFRLPVDYPRFADTGPIENDLVVFPRSAVRIRHEGRPEFVADPGLATIYNRGQRYRRSPVAAEGDRCEWFALDRALAAAVAAEVGPAPPAGPGSPEGPFRFPFAPVSSALYLRQRLLVRRLRAERAVDELEVEEEVVAIAGAVLARARAAAGGGAPPRPAREASGSAGERARELLASSWAEPLSLGEIAARVDASPFHLCRSFRRATGDTLHAHRTRLRLRAALDRLQEGAEDLAALALDLGFASHSHFSAAFRRAYGASPSAVRERLADRSGRRPARLS